MMASRFNVLSATHEELISFVQSIGHPSFRAKQLWQWVHQRGVADFSAMSNLSTDFRTALHSHAEVSPPPLRSLHLAQDGCVKFLFATDSANAVEAVLIPEPDRLTLCISSQVGCAMACQFCATGHQGFNRQLNLAEMVGQLWQVNRYLNGELSDEHGGVHRTQSLQGRRVSNVVLMGMGEPLANYTTTVAALRIFLDDCAYGLSRRRVTVSTSGLVAAIDQLAKDCPVSLAISLHAPNDELRSLLMPVNQRYPLSELLAACHRYLSDAPRAKVMLEYILLEGINNQERHLQELADIARDLPCKINLIPFNRFDAVDFSPPSPESVERFARELQRRAGRVVIVRRTRGDDVAGACGQLAGQVRDIRRSRPPRPHAAIERRTVQVPVVSLRSSSSVSSPSASL